jgi:hypothetical protein
MYTKIYIPIYTYIQKCAYPYKQKWTHPYMYTKIYIYTKMCIPIYIKMYIPICILKLCGKKRKNSRKTNIMKSSIFHVRMYKLKSMHTRQAFKVDKIEIRHFQVCTVLRWNSTYSTVHGPAAQISKPRLNHSSNWFKVDWIRAARKELLC